MAAAAHDPAFARKMGIPQSVATDFNDADKGSKLLSSAMRHRAFGGTLSDIASPDQGVGMRERFIGDTPFRGGLIGGSGFGRTDRLPLSVPSAAYVVPADAVSGTGQGHTGGGGAILSSIFGSGTGPYGSSIPKLTRGPGPSRPRGMGMGMTTRTTTHFAGGGADNDNNTSILAAPGEFVVHPSQVLALGQRAIEQGMAKPGQDPMQVGHELLDKMVKNIRNFIIAWTKSAPPPKK